MTEDIRRNTDRTGELDHRERDVEAARTGQEAARRDAGLEHTEHRPAAQRDVREGEPVRADGGAAHADDAQRRGAAPADPAATDRAVPTDGGAATTDSRVARDTHRDPTSERRPAAGPGTTTAWSGEGLLSSDDRGTYQQRWDDIQVRFIDEPRQCVREADDLVGEVTTRISDRFSSARQDLEQRWDGGNEPTTEELRQAVQRYRDFFQRLVAR